ncbi:hypothetical protein EBT31_19990 [bacterium]|nr:hypothetical protein [bacterium]
MEPKEKRARGRPPHVPTDRDRRQVEVMTGFGLTQEQIGKILNVSEDTLQRHYADEISNGVAKANIQVAQNLFNIATSRDSGAVAAAIFWMKTRGRWRETNHHELTGKDGGPIQTEAKMSVDASALTQEQRDALRAAALAVKNQG